MRTIYAIVPGNNAFGCAVKTSLPAADDADFLQQNTGAIACDSRK